MMPNVIISNSDVLEMAVLQLGALASDGVDALNAGRFGFVLS
jgi:hypothetical protein